MSKGENNSFGCSPFFVTSAILSVASSFMNGHYSIKQAKKDDHFRKELACQKRNHQNQIDAEEWAFKKWMREKQREYLREENVKKLENEIDRLDLQMFFADWPLKIDIQAIPSLVKHDNSKLFVVLARHSKKDQTDMLSIAYDDMVTDVINLLNNVELKRENILTFNDKSDKIGGSAVANVFAMMHAIPTVMVIPQLNAINGNIDFSVGVWNGESSFPLMVRLFSIEYDDNRFFQERNYKNEKMQEIVYSYVAIAAVFNDTFTLLEHKVAPKFPDLAINLKLNSYKAILDFAKCEYNAILNPSAIDSICDGRRLVAGEWLYDKNESDHIVMAARSALDTLLKLNDMD